MKVSGFVVCVSLFAALISCSKENGSGKSDQAYEKLKTDFLNPPTQARPKVYWWWLNGHVDTMRLKQEMLEMKKQGLGGFDIFEIGIPDAEKVTHPILAGSAFMGDEFLKKFKVVIDQAAKLQLEVGFNLASSWNAGGSWTLPEHASKTLYVSRVAVPANSKDIKIPFPVIPEIDPRGRKRVIIYKADGKPLYSEEVAVLAVPKTQGVIDTARIINVSSFFDQDKDVLNWTVPAGQWELQRYVCANSGEQLFMPSNNSIGPIIDHFDSAATRAHVEYFVNRIRPVIPDFKNSPLRYFYLASYEAKDFAWTSTLPQMFRKTSGYDIYKYLPSLFDKTVLDSVTLARFQFDYRNTLSELMINNHYRKAKEVANKYGLKVASESGGPGVYTIPVEVLKALGSLDIPRGEFWHKTTRFDKDSVDIIWLVKEIAAASHIYKRGMVEEEAFTSFSNDWQEGPSDLKPLADRAFCEGMNRVVIHGMTHDPDSATVPGIGYFAGTHFNPKSAWWSKSRPFVDYMSRISTVLQQTEFVSDVLYYYGDDVPNLVPPKNTRFKAGTGYDYEVINTEVLLRDLTVEDGKLVLPGVGKYSVLCLANNILINKDVLEKIGSLAEKGATIIGNKPSKASGLYKRAASDSLISVRSNAIWTDYSNKILGKVYSGTTPLEQLQRKGVGPDFVFAGSSKLDFIHFRKEELDYYLIRNTANKWITGEGTFRMEGKTPEKWDPETGSVTSLPVYRKDVNGTVVTLSFAPYQSYFVCFKPGKISPVFEAINSKGGGQPRLLIEGDDIFLYDDGEFLVKANGKTSEVKNCVETYALNGAWNVSFGNVNTTFERLSPWNESSTDEIKYFSGTASYTQTFDYKGKNSDAKIILQLGDLSKVAEVWLNDVSLGIIGWTQPYQFDITSHIKAGKNTIRIDVANNWANRLIGDAVKGTHAMSTNIQYSNRSAKITWDKTPLIPSGLLGPVTIISLKPVDKKT